MIQPAPVAPTAPRYGYVFTKVSGTSPAVRNCVRLYEVFAEGCHTPLTKEEIAELFRAGRLKPEDWCRNRADMSWRTIDEVFPALRHQPDTWSTTHSRDDIPIVPLAVAAAALVIVALGFALLQNYKSGSPSYVAESQPALIQRSAPHSTELSRIDSNQSGNAAVAMVETRKEVIARERAHREQAALAERMRIEFVSQEREQKKLAGRDEIIPLDQFVTISNVGGSPVQVKVLDNDVTSFDVWINGKHSRNVKKQKGISHSGTDETLIYKNGQASLFYVWEISGKLDSCLLRVREY